MANKGVKNKVLKKSTHPFSEPEILFQDKFLLVLNKPSGWVVNESQTVKATPVVQTWLRKNFRYELAGNQEFRAGIVHRLDKETSGVLVVAKTLDSFRQLQLQFKNRQVKKVYLALVHGIVQPQSGEVRVPVGRLPWNREKFGVVPGGREAITEYKVIRYYHKSLLSFLEVYPKTGRTHQIRVHLRYLGHPVVSDISYAGRKTARKDRSWCPRLFLHASQIEFRHPKKRSTYNVEANLPQELKEVLDFLENKERVN